VKQIHCGREVQLFPSSTNSILIQGRIDGAAGFRHGGLVELYYQWGIPLKKSQKEVNAANQAQFRLAA
jgi:hypothetical protein